jgi:uncharacterized protein
MTVVGRVRIVALAAVVVAAAAATAHAQGTPIPPAPTEFVTDHAGFLSAGYVKELSTQLEDYERGTGHQLIVWIDRTTGGVPIEDWANRAFSAWRVGRKEINDGVALFIFSDDRKLRIEVGYGLEGNVPDARAGRIIQNDMVPLIRDGNHDGAVKAGVSALMAAIGGAPEPKRRPSGAIAGGAIGSLFLMIVLFVVLIRAASYRYVGSRGSGWGGGWWGGGLGGGGWGGGGWGGGGGGGFSGGGGSSGGGGASGGW